MKIIENERVKKKYSNKRVKMNEREDKNAI